MGRKKREFNRLRLDSGQHRRIMLVSALLGALAFLPVGLRLYSLCLLYTSFPPAVHHFTLSYTKYSCGQMASAGEKSLAVGHIPGFQIDPNAIS